MFARSVNEISLSMRTANTIYKMVITTIAGRLAQDVLQFHTQNDQMQELSGGK